MDAMVEHRFGRFVVEPGRRHLLVDGKPAKIGARAYDILMALIDRRQRVVTKGELLDLVWPGIAVEESNLHAQIFALRRLLGADAITTIPGRGYQFTAPLDERPTAISVAPPLRRGNVDIEPRALSRPQTDWPRWSPRSFQSARLVVAACLIASVAAVGAWLFLPGKPLAPVASMSAPQAEDAHLSIVVLPFANLSNDAAQDYFVDGVTENLTTDISRIHKSFVIARNTAFTYKNKDIDAKQIGRELGVRYLLEGSVQRDQNRVRVNAELIDAKTGAQLWADRFEESVADLFKLQDQVVARLGNALGFELVKAEAERSVRSKDPDALDLAMRGWATMWRSYPEPVKQKRDSHYAALALFDQALKIEPNEADALAGISFTHMALFAFAEATAETDLDAKIIASADQAITLAPEEMRAYIAKSFFLAVTGRATEALRTADSGLAINPNSAPLLDARTLAEIALGRFDQAKSDAEQALRLSPRDPEIPNRLLNLGMAELGLGNFDAAIVRFQGTIDSGNRSFIPFVNLAAAYALEGDAKSADTALAEGRRLNPNLTVKWLTAHAPNLLPLFAGLRKAGLPEE
jgi:TolB-like protein/DNA-binding winged helix-turn-helix (wHTH) protein